MKLVFATHNQNKMKEVATLMPSYIELLSLTDIGCFDEIPETSSTIEGNALLKANFVKEHYGFDCFADDTGLEVQELNNEPGVYSARYAGPANDAQANMDKLLANLNNESNRNARFKTVIVFIQSEKIEFFTHPKNSFPTYDAFCFLVDSRSRAIKIRKNLIKKNYATKILPEASSWHFAGEWEHIENINKKNLTKSKVILDRTVALPLSMKSKEKNVDEISQIIIEAMSGK